MDRFSRLDYSFYSQPTLIVAATLLGKQLVKTEEDGSILSGLITEVEFLSALLLKPPAKLFMYHLAL